MANASQPSTYGRVIMLAGGTVPYGTYEMNVMLLQLGGNSWQLRNPANVHTCPFYDVTLQKTNIAMDHRHELVHEI